MINANIIDLLMDYRPSAVNHRSHTDSLHAMDLNPLHTMKQQAKRQRSLYLSRLFRRQQQ